MAEMAFLVNELREHDAGLAQWFENEIEQAASEVEPGERLHCFVFIDPLPAPGAQGALVRMRVGQMGWYRDFPPVSVDESPLALSLALSRQLRRNRRPRPD